MIELVLDANIAIDWFVISAPGEAYSAHLARYIETGAIQFHVPLNFEPEVAGQLVTHHRHKPKIYTKQWLSDALAALDSLPIMQHALGINFQTSGALAASYRLTVYDLQYFHLARVMGCPIASRDKGIISACKHWNVSHWTQ